MLKKTIVLVTLGTALATLTAAQARPGKKPPKEAVNACSNKADGDSCSFEHRNRQIQGTCFAPDDQAPLACRPERPPGPPAEAVDACDGAQVGDACSFQHDGRDLEGTCRQGPNGDGPVACAPHGGRPHPECTDA